MISWDDAITMANKFCQDSTASGSSFQQMLMNVGYKQVLAAIGRQIVDQQAASPLVVGQRNYQVPPDCNMPKEIVLIDGATRYPLIEEPSDRDWEARRSQTHTGRPFVFHFRPRFGVGGGIIELDPLPAAAYTLELTYEATERDLSKSKYTTGSVALTGAPTASAIIVGTGTTFTADMVGRYFMPTADGAQRLPYRIKTFTDTTHLVMENVYQGPTQTGMAFAIFEMFALPEDCHMLPIDYCAWQWYSTKGSPVRAAEHKAAFTTGLADAKTRHSVTVRDETIDTGAGLGGLFASDTPGYFPQSII